MTINEEQQLGRTKNAILAFLERRISIPKIYIDAIWDGHQVDVLAIDRDGVGDVHAVLIFSRNYFSDGLLNIVHEGQSIASLMGRFEAIPAQYKYIAVADLDPGRYRAPFGVADTLLERSFSPDGLGRVGFLTIAAQTEGEPKVTMEIKPERFRAKIAKLADEYVQQHEPDWEIRA
jgi:hypothetical protein